MKDILLLESFSSTTQDNIAKMLHSKEYLDFTLKFFWITATHLFIREKYDKVIFRVNQYFNYSPNKLAFEL